MNHFISIHDKFGTYLEVTSNIKDILGYDEDDLIGKSAYEFFHPECLSNIVKSHVSSLNSTVNYRIRSKNGNYVYVKTESFKIKDIIYCITNKISLIDIFFLKVNELIRNIIEIKMFRKF